MTLSTTISWIPPLFHSIFYLGKQRSLVANLIVLSAGWHQNQILALPCLLTRVMRALGFSTKTMIKTRHPHRHECSAKFLLCCPIPSETLLPLDFFENSSLNNGITGVKSYPQKLCELTLALAQPNEFSFSFRSVHELAWEERHWLALGQTTWVDGIGAVVSSR